MTRSACILFILFFKAATDFLFPQLPSVPGIAFQLTRTKIGRALYQIDPVVSAVHTDILARLNTYAQQNRRSFLGVLPVTALLRLLRLVPSTQEETIRVWLREHHEEVSVQSMNRICAGLTSLPSGSRLSRTLCKAYQTHAPIACLVMTGRNCPRPCSTVERQRSPHRWRCNS